MCPGSPSLKRLFGKEGVEEMEDRPDKWTDNGGEGRVAGAGGRPGHGRQEKNVSSKKEERCLCKSAQPQARG